MSQSFSPSVYASHYGPGIEGLDNAKAPGPGLYYRGYALEYRADSYEGEGAPENSEVTVNVAANRFVWVTGANFLGADVIAETVIPLINIDLNIGNGAVRDEQFNVEDIFVGSVLSWHNQWWDAVAGAGMWFDTLDDDSPADPGHDYNEVMLTYGANFYLTDKKDVSISALSRYLIPDDSEVDEELIVEWGLKKNLETGIDIGIVGYDLWQTSGGNSESHAIGVEAGYFWGSIKLGLNAAYYNDYDSSENFEGDTFRLTLTKVL
ncbi:hypothetical protein GCM10007877_05170 [Marinibactrum halimedae]|uniref:Transporter n=1 Tax=Marinibactrum halimedae TaxID=1444977 RepID=A0AA37T209_9GAMM|nr:hypothetical protein GCM10007877_05170 [Marinibactrum halimedae]